MKKQSGNIIEWLILGVVLIGVVALVAWRYMETDKDQNNATQANNSNQVVPKTESGHQGGGVYSLEKWTILVNLPQDLKSETDDISVVYYKDESAGTIRDAYYFVSKALKAAKFTCEKTAALETNGAFLVVQRSHNQPPSQPGTNSKQMGEYYYWVEKTLQSSCYDQKLTMKYFADDYAQSLLDTVRNKVDQWQ